MKFSFSEKQVVILILAFTFIIFCINALMFVGSYGGGDGIRHYLVSRYSWKHPEQFFYSWGKPFFTLISSPFSQFGLKGIKIFNSALAIVFAWIAFLIAHKLHLKNAWIVVVFSLFSPLTVQTVNSGLTEPMFAVMIILCAWLFMNEKYLWATILISFLPFVRSEGNLILPLFAIILFIRKKFWLIPVLAFGTIAYSIAGYFYYHDIFWIQTQNPYKGLNHDLYGEGPLLHYVTAYNEIFGIPLTVLFVLGLPVIAFLFLKKLFNIKNIFLDKDLSYEELFLLHGAFIIYFVAHSIFWWKGLYGSLGLIRSMAGVVPLAAFTCLRGVNLIEVLIHRFVFIKNIVLTSIACCVIFYAFKRAYFPLKLEPEEQVIQQVGDWYKTTNYHPPKIYYLYPYLAHAIHFDAFDTLKVGELWRIYKDIKDLGFDKAVPEGTIIFWDAHFAANEAHLPLDSLSNNPNYTLLKSFNPDIPFKTLGGYNFTVNIFERKIVLDPVILTKTVFDLEDNLGLTNSNCIKDTNAHSGQRASVMNSNTEYSMMYERNCMDLKLIQKSSEVSVKFYFNSKDPIKDAWVVFAIENNEGRNLQWSSSKISVSGSDWILSETKFQMKKVFLNEDNRVKIYIWNKGKENFLLDDLQITFNNLYN